MKPWIKVYGPPSIESPPAWEAWIETGSITAIQIIMMSPPAWEAWIETSGQNDTVLATEVASRMGGVD